MRLHKAFGPVVCAGGTQTQKKFSPWCNFPAKIQYQNWLQNKFPLLYYWDKSLGCLTWFKVLETRYWCFFIKFHFISNETKIRRGFLLLHTLFDSFVFWISEQFDVICCQKNTCNGRKKFAASANDLFCLMHCKY